MSGPAWHQRHDGGATQFLVHFADLSTLRPAEWPNAGADLDVVPNTPCGAEPAPFDVAGSNVAQAKSPASAIQVRGTFQNSGNPIDRSTGEAAQRAIIFSASQLHGRFSHILTFVSSAGPAARNPNTASSKNGLRVRTAL